MSSVAEKPDETFAQRLLRWGRRTRLGRRSAIGLAILSVVSGIATYAILTDATFVRPEQGLFRALLWFDLVLLLTLGAVVARRLVVIWGERRRGSAGSRLHTRFVTLFSVVAVTPASSNKIILVMEQPVGSLHFQKMVCRQPNAILGNLGRDLGSHRNDRESQSADQN